MTEPDTRAAMLEAAKLHVPFDGWSESRSAPPPMHGWRPAIVRAVLPRGAVDLALAFHEEGDRAMLARLEAEDLGACVSATASRRRCVTVSRPRRTGSWCGAAPRFSPAAACRRRARAVWRTCDRIWTALGDRSDDVNWYTKRATLPGVSSTVLYWLGDDSPGIRGDLGVP